MNVANQILALSVGGTIAMEQQTNHSENEGYVIKPSKKLSDIQTLLQYLGLTEFQKQYNIHLVTVPVANLDSNNIHPVLWTKVVKTIVTECQKRFIKTNQYYKGVIITTGTDTKEFFAPAIAAAFGPSLNMPVLFVSSQSTPAQQTGDARQNFARSLAVIQNTEETGSLLVNGEKILEAARSIKTSENQYSYMTSDRERGFFVNDGILVSENMSLRRKYEAPPFDEKDILSDFADNVLAIRAIPGFKPGILLPVLPNLNGLIIIPNGASHLTDHEIYSFRPLLQEAKKIDLPVLVTSPFAFGRSDKSNYEVGQIVYESNCITNNGLTMGAATSMFYLSLAQAKTAMKCGEIRKGQLVDFVKRKMAANRFSLSENPYVIYSSKPNYVKSDNIKPTKPKHNSKKNTLIKEEVSKTARHQTRKKNKQQTKE